jgi:hypothetical protein
MTRSPLLPALALASSLLAPGATAAADPAVTLGYETGPAYIAQNDGRYGDAGTAYDAGEVGQQKNLLVAERTTLELQAGRHHAILLFAPFGADTRVTLTRDLQFRDTLFPAGTVVDHRYRFDGVRASYLYRAVRGRLSLDVGASLQIRNADVAFTSADGALHDAQDDIGLVGALKARLRLQATEARFGELEVDALSTFGLAGDTSGGIYDVALIAGQRLAEPLELVLVARLLGGGAEVPSKAIDTWANFASASVGLRLRLDRAW